MVCCPSELNIHYPYSFVYILCIFYLFIFALLLFLFLSRSWKLTKPKKQLPKEKKNRRETKRKKKKQICNKCSSFSCKVIIYLYSTTLPLFNKSVYIHYLLNIYYTFLLIVLQIEHILKN